MPPKAFLAGNFSSYINIAKVYDPTTGKPFPNNQIPTSRIAPLAKYFQKYYSMPNNQGTSTGQLGTNFTFSDPSSERNPRYSYRIDWQANSKNRIMGRYYQSNDVHPHEPCFCGSNSLLFGNFEDEGTLSKNFAFNWFHIFNAYMINELVLGYNHLRYPYVEQNNNVNPGSIIPGLLNVPAGHGGLPNIYISDFTRIGGFGSDFNNGQHTIQINDNLSLIKGNHNLKLGFQYIKQRSGQGKASFGNFSFDGRFTSEEYASLGKKTNSYSINPVNAYADFLLGYIDESSTQNRINMFDTLDTSYGIYAEDSYKANERLTLDTGIRYDKTFPFNINPGGLSNWYPSTNKLVYVRGPIDLKLLSAWPITMGSSVGINSHNFMRTQNSNLSPRIGFAYLPTAKSNLVIRGGFAMTYDYFTSLINGLSSNPPAIAFISYEVSGGYSPSLTWEDPFPKKNGKLPTNVNLSAVERNPKTPYNEQWNLSIENEFANNTAIRISYIGNAGRHLPIPDPINASKPGPLANNQTIQSLSPYKPWGGINYLIYGESTNLNELQIALRRRIARLTFDLEYQHLKALGLDEQNDGGPTNPYNFSYDYGNMDYYSHDLIEFNYSYELPFGRGQRFEGHTNNVVNALIGGWTWTGILSAYSGQPFSVNFTSSVPNWPSNRASRDYTVSAYPKHKSYKEWFDSKAFYLPTEYTYGKQSRNDVFGPGYANWDSGLLKNIQLGRQLTWEIRVSCFNVLNRTNFNSPSNNISSNTAGQIMSQAGEPRQIQFGTRFSF